MKDYDVPRERSVAILDSLFNRDIPGSFVLYTDNVNISTCIIHADSFSDVIDTPKISGNNRRILKKLGIDLPNRNLPSSSACPADLVLFIQNLELEINPGVQLNESGLAFSTEDNYELEARNIVFVIWDYKKNCIVSSGKIDASATAHRIKPSESDSTKDSAMIGLGNKYTFWPFLLRAFGNRIAAATPFSMHAIDSLMNEEQWGTMKKIQLFHPQRDSAIIAGKLEAIYPLVTQSIDNIATLSNRDSVRLNLEISPNGTIISAFLPDSIVIDSAVKAKLKKVLSVPLCDSITNPRIYTDAILIIRKASNKDRVQIMSVKNVETRKKAGIEQIIFKACNGSLRFAYNRRLKEGMNKDGKIVVKFIINDSGSVTHSSIVSSTMNEPQFEEEIASIIKTLKFERIYNPDNICEAVYPFIFTQ